MPCFNALMGHFTGTSHSLSRGPGASFHRAMRRPSFNPIVAPRHHAPQDRIHCFLARRGGRRTPVLLRVLKRILPPALNGPPRPSESSASTLLFAKNAKSKPVSSPAVLVGIGIRRAVRGLPSRNANAARSRSSAAIWYAVVAPGSGMVSSPVPHTAEYSSRSLIDRLPSEALLARVASSITGS